jgi:predicted SAM-dependent methyltransferase
MNTTNIKRLNWGCGSWTPEGWINSDIKDDPGVNLVADISKGLPLDTNSIDYAVSIHSLPEIPYPDLVPTLAELRRVLKPGGVLRVALPDLDLGIAAYQRGEKKYFLIPDEEVKSVGAKFIVQMLWYGYTRLLFTHDFIIEMLEKAGFSRVERCAHKVTRSLWPEITDLDNREEESLFVEAFK